MYRLALPFGLACAASLLGCGGSHPATAPNLAGLPGVTPTPIAGPIDAQLGVSAVIDDATYTPAALWTLDIDPVTLTASTRNITERTAQASGGTYLLDVASFFEETPLEITGVERSADNLRVHYTITHPIAPAIDPDAPASGTNRADLGVTGITLFLVDASPTDTVYFSDSDRQIRGDVDLIANADGFFYPGDMINHNGLANIFPYRRLVDDSGLGTRIGHPNATPGVGNFGAQSGWQRNTWGADHMGWTGFGALHQGQTSANSVDISLTAMGAAPVSLKVALIARWTDPVGGATLAERAANRLPPVVKDPAKFLYRMPHGAWDLERLEVADIEGDFDGRHANAVDLHLRAVDWDAKATETTFVNLTQEPVASIVGHEQSGLPRFSISIPSLPGFDPVNNLDGDDLLLDDDRAYGGDLAADSGRADDPLHFRIPLPRTEVPILTEGSYPGMIRVMDETERRHKDIALNPLLIPINTDLPFIEAFAVFTVDVKLSPLPVSVTITNDPLESGDQLDLHITVDSTPADPHQVQFDWDNSGNYWAEIYNVDPVFDFTSHRMVNPTLATRQQAIRVKITNVITDDVEERIVPYTIGPNHAPAGTVKLESARLPSPAMFRMTDIVNDDVDRDPLTMTITNDRTADVIFWDGAVPAFPMDLMALPLTNPPDDTMTFTVRLNDPAHPDELGTVLDPIVCEILPPGIEGWVKPLNDRGFLFHRGGLGSDDAGNIYVFGWLLSPFDFGGGVLESPNGIACYLVSYDSDGDYRWGKVIDSAAAAADSNERPRTMHVTGAGKIIIAMQSATPIDFGGGERDALAREMYACYDNAGGYLSDFSIRAKLETNDMFTLATGPAGEIVGAGASYTGSSIDLGGGSRPVTQGPCGFIFSRDASGIWQWDQVYTGGRQEFWDMSVAPDGTIYAVGSIGGTVDFGGGLRTMPSYTGLAMSLTGTGTYRWDRQFTSSGTGILSASSCLAASDNSGVVITGSAGTPVDLGNGEGEAGGYMVRLDADGVWEWETRNCGNGWELAEGVSGEIHVVGSGSGSFVLGTTPYTAGDYDAFAATYSADGTFRWGDVWQGDDDETVPLFTRRPAGDLILGITHTSTIDADPGPGTHPLPDIGTTNNFLIRLDGATGQL